MKTAAVPLSFARILGKHCNFEVMACCVAAWQVSQNHREIWLPGLKYCAMLPPVYALTATIYGLTGSLFLEPRYGVSTMLALLVLNMLPTESLYDTFS